jgi:hypothetical protein
VKLCTLFPASHHDKSDDMDPLISKVFFWPLACWDCGFEYCRRHGCLSVVSVVCWQVEVSATSRSLVQRSPTECCVSECDDGFSIMRRLGGCLGGGGIAYIYNNTSSGVKVAGKLFLRKIYDMIYLLTVIG